MTYGSKKWREWVLDEDESRPFFRRALEAGINFFDTADIYSDGVSEEVTGRALKDFAARPRGHRHQGLQPDGQRPEPARPLAQTHSPCHRRQPERLGTDYVDLYQIHRFDYDTPIEETMRALDDIVRAGKALYIGASSMFAYQFAKMLAVSDAGAARFVSMQNHYNLVYREEEREMLPLCREEGLEYSLESAGPRVPGRQSPRAGFRRDNAGHVATISRRRCTFNRPTSTWWIVWARSPGNAASPTRRWRWRGSCNSPE